ncbi:hypothetical protein DKX38_025966 [Salix brachista]|uniref:Rab-GAP TBC domain-containing protein n=1 Tax=Salix brachista TaxID=2182728 RepID=A0A5N5K332_9ROSI|nr:hypothetical protein DKX38_025966 [Salix brachista]
MWRNPGQPADSYYQVRPECTDVPKTRFKIKAGKTLSPRKWQAAFTPEGGSIHQLEEKFGNFYSVVLTLRVHLMNEMRFGSTEVMPIEDMKTLFLCCTFRLQYARWKEECRQIFPVVGSGRFITAPVITEDGQPIQEPLVILETNQDRSAETGNSDGNGTIQSRLNGSCSEMVRKLTSHGPLDQKVIQWLLTLHQIGCHNCIFVILDFYFFLFVCFEWLFLIRLIWVVGLDVHRTDRTLVFYEKQENLSKLWDILAVYAWIDTDVGYCQGMSDLCSPMIMLLEDEADAFWCFERLMRRLRGNFRCTESSVGVETQLSNLAEITQVIDPKLHQHLDALGGGDYLFAFRMLMVLFRREFSFCDSLYLWEMMWALEYDPDLFSIYEEPELNGEKAEGSKGRTKSIRHYGKFERENMKNGAVNSESPLPISIFLVASVLKDKSSMLLHEARGLDDVVKVSLMS